MKIGQKKSVGFHPLSMGLKSLAVATVASTIPFLPAQALSTFSLSYLTVQGTGSLNGSMTIDTSDPNAKTAVTGGPFPSWFHNLKLTYSDGVSTYNYDKSNYSELYWIPNNPGTVNWVSDLVPQFLDINFGPIIPNSNALVSAQGNFRLMSTSPDINQYELSSVNAPGPLPLFGAAGAFCWSRQIRRRQRRAVQHSSF